MRPSAAVLDHTEHPRNAGSFPAGTEGVAVGVARGDNDGDMVKLHIRVVERRITEARFQAFGCSSTLAAASRLTEIVTGLAIETAGSIDATEIANDLAIAPDKSHAARLAVAALHSALEFVLK